MTNPLLEPGILIGFGPLVRGCWEVPGPLLERLVASGRQPPLPVEGLFLVDTGALRSCIGVEVAQELGLRPRGIIPTRGAAGVHQSPEYFARMTFPNTKAGQRQPGMIAKDQRAIGVPGLNRYFPERTPTNHDSATYWRIIGLIGRDLLQNLTFVLDGPNTTFSLYAET